MSLLEFDFQLRAILFEALSKYEQQLKTRVAYHLGALDPLAHENRTGLTFNDEQYTKWKQKYDAGVNWASKTAYVRHHDQNYGGHLPIWVAIETMSLGTVTQLVKFAHQGLLTKIADEFNCQARQFKSWALSLVPLRNATFHHERLWNNQFQAAPEVRQAPDLLLHLKQMDSNQRNRLYPRLAVLAWLDREDQFGMDFKSRLVTRVNQLPVHPRIKLAQMGFPPDWQKLDLWAN